MEPEFKVFRAGIRASASPRTRSAHHADSRELLAAQDRPCWRCDATVAPRRDDGANSMSCMHELLAHESPQPRAPGRFLVAVLLRAPDLASPPTSSSPNRRCPRRRRGNSSGAPSASTTQTMTRSRVDGRARVAGGRTTCPVARWRRRERRPCRCARSSRRRTRCTCGFYVCTVRRSVAVASS